MAIGGKKGGICNLWVEQNQTSATAKKSFESISLRRRKCSRRHCEHNNLAGQIGPPMVTRVVKHFEHSLAVFVGPFRNSPAELYLRLRRFADTIAGAHQDDQICLAQQFGIGIVS